MRLLCLRIRQFPNVYSQECQRRKRRAFHPAPQTALSHVAEEKMYCLPRRTPTRLVTARILTSVATAWKSLSVRKLCALRNVPCPRAVSRVGGRPIVVDYETGRVKGSFRLADGQKYQRVAKQHDDGGGGGGTFASSSNSFAGGGGGSGKYGDGSTGGSDRAPKHRPTTSALTGKEWREAMFGARRKK